MSKILTVLASSVASQTLNFLPEQMFVDDPSNIDKIVITEKGGGVIVNLTSNAQVIEALSINRIGIVVGMLPLANGYIRSKAVEITVETNAGGAANIFIHSEKEGDIVFKTYGQKCLANSSITFDNFVAVSVSAGANADNIVLSNDETNGETVTVEELKIQDSWESSTNTQAVISGAVWNTATVVSPSFDFVAIIIQPSE